MCVRSRLERKDEEEEHHLFDYCHLISCSYYTFKKTRQQQRRRRQIDRVKESETTTTTTTRVIFVCFNFQFPKSFNLNVVVDEGGVKRQHNTRQCVTRRISLNTHTHTHNKDETQEQDSKTILYTNKDLY